MSATNEALRQDCVAHWDRMQDLTVEDILAAVEFPDVNNCAFCREYIQGDCKGCPIHNHTGQPGCGGTPFRKTTDLYIEISRGEHRRLAEFKRASKKMADFIRELPIKE